jgi:hypothetical protein
VLADSASAGADYIDVTVPSRPAAGAGSDSNASSHAVGTGAALAAGGSAASTGAPSGG